MADPLRALFDSLDADGSGKIERQELEKALRALGVRADSVAMILAVDADADQRIDWREFEKSFAHLREAGRPLSPHALLATWSALGAGVHVGGDLSGSASPPAGTPLWRFALAGSLGGAASRLATAPLEKLTIVMQLSGRTGLASMRRAARDVAARDGVRGFWAGAATNALRVGAFGGAVCVGYSQALARTPADAALDAREPLWRASAGALAGLGATLATHPLDVVRTRLTAARTAPTPWRAARALMAEEGMRGLFRGLTPACLSVVPFSLYDTSKAAMTSVAAIEPSAALFAACGVVAGVSAQTCVYPLDVLRRRMQTASHADESSRTLRGALRGLLQAGGPRALFAGIVPTWLRVAPAAATSLLVRDAVLGRLSK
ncbi:hypothetical protein AB1Y20_006225 [Prymnesium parvum]|uniref:EF-hand domain-containing protein n=1 Tax=Prymnesium parvum TaxID=97485 RepID=A0AB34J2M6_PRYPA